MTDGRKIKINNTTAQWQKVERLRPGMNIACLDNNDVMWDEIVEIKHVGREEVFDIEVEDTHNFVGNGIFAHNTYISENLGIGDTNPGSKLSVTGLGSSTGTTLVIDANGDVWKDSSSIKYKEDIRDYSAEYEKLLNLSPISFTYKKTGAKSFGYLAEEFDKMGLSDLVVYDLEGRPDAIRYDKLSIYSLELLKKQDINIQQTADTLNQTIEETNLEIGQKVDQNTQKISELEVRINELAAPTEESTESTQSAQADASKILTQIISIYEELKEFVASLGMSVNTDEEGNKNLTISTDLNALGDTTLFDTFITGDLAVGTITINSLESSISTVASGETLYLQNYALAGNLDVFNGKIVLEPNGTVNAEKVVAGAYAVSEGSDTVGGTVLPADELETVVETGAVKESSKIFLTPTTSVNGQTLYIKLKSEGESFTVAIDRAISDDIEFDWWIVDVE